MIPAQAAFCWVSSPTVLTLVHPKGRAQAGTEQGFVHWAAAQRQECRTVLMLETCWACGGQEPSLKHSETFTAVLGSVKHNANQIPCGRFR